MKLALTLLAIFCVGFFVSMQPAMNAEISRRLQSPTTAALASLTISFLVLLPVLLVLGPRPQLANASSLPWWAFLGGVAGACFVLSAILSVPVIGTGLFLVAVIIGQLAGASVIDHLGLFNLQVKPFNLYKLCGLALMVAGLLVFLRGNAS